MTITLENLGEVNAHLHSEKQDSIDCLRKATSGRLNPTWEVPGEPSRGARKCRANHNEAARSSYVTAGLPRRGEVSVLFSLWANRL